MQTASNYLIFSHACLQGNVPSALKDTTNLIRLEHNQISRNQVANQVNIPAVRTVTSGTNSIKSKSAYAWNEINSLFLSKDLIHKGSNFCKNLLKDHFVARYYLVYLFFFKKEAYVIFIFLIL